jgi:transcriptional regulator with XRE-family HTH domain
MSRKRYRSLSEYLEKGGETQVSLAARVGVTQSAISKAASGRVSLSLAKKLARATGVPLESFGSQEERAA